MDANYSIVAATAEIISEFVQHQELARQSEQSDWFRRFFEFSLSCHSSLELNESGSVLANDARFLLQAERTQVYFVRQNRVWLGAVSSVANVEKRSALMRLAKSLAKSCARHGQPLLSNHPQLPSAQRELLENYLATSGMKFVACIPLRSPIRSNLSRQGGAKQDAGEGRSGQRKDINGILLAEYPELPSQMDFVRAAKFVLPHAGLNIANAKSYSTIPFRKTLTALQTLTRIGNVSRILIAGVLLAVALVLLVTVPMDHRIRIKGELRPEVERVVFAPLDAFVEKVHIKEGDRVSEGELLVSLSSPELTQKLDKMNGELAKQTEHKSSKQILLNQAASGNVGDAQLQTELASEIADIEFQIQSTLSEIKFLKSQLAKLEIHSPITGTVVTWNVQQSLDRRPVKWGDPLMKLADEESQWELRLKAPENKVAYILEANDRQDDSLAVDYFFKSRPNEKYQSKIEEVAPSTEPDEEFGPSVAIRCLIDEKQVNRRHGAKVFADVRCGRKSIGYVWTYELVDTLKRRFVW